MYMIFPFERFGTTDGWFLVLEDMVGAYGLCGVYNPAMADLNVTHLNYC
jgi:hypothetical protein